MTFSLRTVKNNLLKHFNKNSVEVFKYYNHQDDLESVEIFVFKDGWSEKHLFKDSYLHEWHRFLSRKKYTLGLGQGCWVTLNEGYTFDETISIGKEFYTK